LIGVTADEHWVIHHGPTYALLLIANGQPAAPSPLRHGQLRAAASRPRWAGSRRAGPGGRPPGGRPRWLAPVAGSRRAGQRPPSAVHPGAGPRRGLSRPRPGRRPGPAARASRADGTRRWLAAGHGPAALLRHRAGRADRPRRQGHTIPALRTRPRRRPDPNHTRSTDRRGRIADVAGESAVTRHLAPCLPAGHQAYPGRARAGAPAGQPGQGRRHARERGPGGTRY
jgi:hypothetical protein